MVNTSSKLFHKTINNCPTPCSPTKTFNNTDTWSSTYLTAIENITPEALSIYDKIPNISPPQNCSDETKKELEDIKMKQKNITPEQRQQINDELSIIHIYSLFQLTICEKKVMNKLMTNYLIPIIMKLKKNIIECVHTI